MTKNTKCTTLPVEAEAFAGISAGCTLSGELYWINPENITPEQLDQSPQNAAKKKSDYSIESGYVGDIEPNKLLKLSETVEGSPLGIGAKGGLAVGLSKGKLRVYCSAKIAFGAGAGGSFEAEVDADSTYEFVMFCYHQLKNNRYDPAGIFIAYAGSDAYEYYSELLMLVIWDLGNIADLIDKTYQNLKNRLQLFFYSGSAIDAKVLNIKQNNKYLHFATPKTKAETLYLLMNPDIENEFNTLKLRIDVLTLDVLAYIQSVKELVVIFTVLYYIILKKDTSILSLNGSEASKAWYYLTNSSHSIFNIHTKMDPHKYPQYMAYTRLQIGTDSLYPDDTKKLDFFKIDFDTLKSYYRSDAIQHAKLQKHNIIAEIFS